MSDGNDHNLYYIFHGTIHKMPEELFFQDSMNLKNNKNEDSKKCSLI